VWHPLLDQLLVALFFVVRIVYDDTSAAWGQWR
jgi:hypothetical protein